MKSRKRWGEECGENGRKNIKDGGIDEANANKTK
jgi:hypothetical protein